MRSGVLLAALLAGCGSPPASTDLPCGAELMAWPNEGQTHVAEGTQVTYGSNPPNSGSHYPVWGRWGTHTETLARGYYVHNLEHGGVVLLYHCDTPCPDLVAGLQAILDNRPQDPACSPAVRSRVVLTADPLLDVPLAAAAWQHTYRAQCLDPASLSAFIDANYDQGPESLCNEGSVPLN